MVTIDVQGQIMKAICCDSIVADSINMLEIKFNFSGEWNGMTKTAQFTQGEEGEKPTTYNVLIDENGLADVPNEIKAGTVYVGVFGVLGSQRMTTAPLALLVKKSSFVGDGETPIPPTPDLYQQLVMQVYNTAGSPVIGENGNWFLDNQDTGVKADWSAEQENAAASAAAAEAAAAQAKAVHDSLPPEYGELAALVNQKAPAIPVDASGDIVTVTDGAEGMPVQSLITHVEPVQEGEGDPSPNNVRPIIGWDEVSVTGAKRNLLYHSSEKVEDMTLKNSSGADINRKGYLVEIPAGDYVIKSEYKEGYTSGTFITGLIVDAGLQNHGKESLRVVNSTAVGTFKFSLEPGEKLALYNGSTSQTVDQTKTAFDKVNLYIFVDDGNTENEEYNGQTLTANLPETLYGFEKDWTTGLVTVTHISYVLDGVNNKFAGVYTANGLRYAVYLLPFYGDKSNNKTSLLTTHLKTVQRVEYGCAYVAGAEGQQLLAYIKDFADVAEANAWLVEQAAAGTPFQICYKLVTPYTIQLTPQQMETLKGVNNIWSNAGETTVTYAADTKLYIDRQIAAIAAAMLNN